MFDLSTRDIKYLQGVAAACGHTEQGTEYLFLSDLLCYFPYKYVDRSRPVLYP